MITYLNTPTETPTKVQRLEPTAPSTPLSICVEPPTDNTDSISEVSFRSGEISPVLSHVSVVDVPPGIEDVDGAEHGETNYDLETQNLILRNQIEALKNDLILISHRAKSSESGNFLFR